MSRRSGGREVGQSRPKRAARPKEMAVGALRLGKGKREKGKVRVTRVILFPFPSSRFPFLHHRRARRAR